MGCIRKEEYPIWVLESIRLAVLSLLKMTKIEQQATTVIDGRLIQQGGGFMFNDKLFDEYQSSASCTKFRDEDGKIFDSITVYYVVNVSTLGISYISTDRGLFMYAINTGEVTALSYALKDIVFMQVVHYTAYQKDDILMVFYPQYEGTTITGYGARKVTFDENGILICDDMKVTLPSDITWMKHKNRNDTSLNILSGCPIGYAGNNNIWFSKYVMNDNVINITIDKLILSNVTEITDAINLNTVMMKTDGNNQYYFAIGYNNLYSNQEVSCEYSDIGDTYQYTAQTTIEWYDQYYSKVNDVSSTFALVIDTDTNILSFASIVFISTSTSPTYSVDYRIHPINSDESNGGINGGYVNNDIKHRLYTIINESGYTNGTTVYATRRHIFASSTRLMDINDNPFAALMYHRTNDSNYSILPSAGKTPIFTINASINIDKKYGTVIATDYNALKGLYYIYTDSHVGIYFITTRQLTWAMNDIMTKIKDIYSFSDITVIDGQAKEFVNGIMTTTAMNGPTFDQLYTEIADLRKRIAVLESMIRTEKITYSNRTVDECIVWNRKIGSGSGDVSNPFFLKEGGYSIVPDIRYGIFKDTDGTERDAGVMEIGNFIDFHVPNTKNNEGIHTQKDHDGCSSVAEDFCARIYVDKNNSLIIKANGLYYQPLNGTTSQPINTTNMDTGSG